VPVPFVENLSAGADVLVVGKQFRTNDFNNSNRANGYAVLDGILQYRLPQMKKLGMKTYFKVLNLLDQEYEAGPSSNGTTISTGVNPSLPRTWVAGVSWEL
jgi:outer membrane receptor protein involved in Fe transport